MARHGPTRRALLASAAGTAAAVTGCLGGAEGDADDGADDAAEPVVDEAVAVTGDTDPGAWRNVESLWFDGWVGGWVGIRPAAIHRVENPTLVLVDGREYEISWQNRDGIHHNFAFWNADREVVEDYSTPGTDVEGESETLVVEATPEMDTYRCEYQPEGQLGDVEIVDPA